MGDEEVPQGLGGSQDGKKTAPVLARLAGGGDHEAAQQVRRRPGAPGLDVMR